VGSKSVRCLSIKICSLSLSLSLLHTHTYMHRFCRRHRDNQSKDLDYAVRILPEKIKRGTEISILVAVRYVLERCEDLRTCGHRNKPECEELCYVNFLADICSVCAGYRRLVVRTLLRDDDTFNKMLLNTRDTRGEETLCKTSTPCALEKLVVCLVVFKEKTTDAFAMMYLKLLFDPEFKRRFSDYFVKAYSSLMSKMLNAIHGIGYSSVECKAVNEFMDRIFVQLFANPDRVLEMTKEYRVPFRMLRSCDELFREEIMRFKHRKLIDSVVIRNRTYTRAFSDIRTVLGVEVSSYLLFETNFLDDVMVFMKSYDYLDPQVRKADGDHVLHVHEDSSREAFYLIHDIVLVTQRLVAGVKQRIQSINNRDQISLRKFASRILRVIMRGNNTTRTTTMLKEDLHSGITRDSSLQQHDWRVFLNSFRVSKDAVSFHCPTQRFALRMLAQVLIFLPRHSDLRTINDDDNG